MAIRVDTLIGIGLTKYLNRNNDEESNLPVGGCEKQRLYVEVPFIGNQTEPMKKKIQHLTGSIRPDLDVRFVAKPPRTVKTFFPTKDPLPKHLQSNTVYATTCKDCGDTYVGMTKRQTVTRLCEHGAPKEAFDRETNNNVDRAQPITVQQRTRSSRNTTAKVKAKQQQQQQHQTPPLRRSSRIQNRTATLATTVTNTNDDRQSDHTTKTKERTKNVDNSSSIAEHEETTGHHMDWRNCRIVWRDNNVCRLLIKESLIIRAHEPRLNRTTHSVPLLVFPEGLERHLVPDPNG